MKPFEKRRGHMAISGGAGDSLTGPTSLLASVRMMTHLPVGRELISATSYSF